MKSVLVLSVVIAAALAAPALLPNTPTAYITRYDNDNSGIDSYSYNVETSDGQSKSEQGQLQNIGTDHESISARGQYSFVGDDGVTYTVTYIADENGFQPQGAHLPQAPQ